MLDIAIAHALAEAGFGKVGESIFWNARPVWRSEGIPPAGWLWVNTTTIDAGDGILTDRVTLSPREPDPVRQELVLFRLLHWADTLAHMDDLTCAPECDVRIHLTAVPDSRTITIDTADDRGRYLKSLNLTVSYRMEADLPDIRVAASNAQGQPILPKDWEEEY